MSQWDTHLFDCLHVSVNMTGKLELDVAAPVCALPSTIVTGTVREDNLEVDGVLRRFFTVDAAAGTIACDAASSSASSHELLLS